MIKKFSKLNKTIKVTSKLIHKYEKKIKLGKSFEKKFFLNKTIIGNSLKILDKIPDNKIDLIIADPPYNLTKSYNGNVFKKKGGESYEIWIDKWIHECHRILKKNGTIYICCDWKSSIYVHNVLSKYFFIKNRITWAREKGRGSKNNWKNNIEDIWFATKSKNNYVFNINKVKIKKNVIAPYINKHGLPKDWQIDKKGKKFRLTFPSNIWTDLTIPFWSMSENTVHSTQKPEKLIARIILASSNEKDIVLDPFVGSGTTSVVAKKLNRYYLGIEKDLGYSCITEKRLKNAEKNKKIQGYDGVFFLDKKNTNF